MAYTKPEGLTDFELEQELRAVFDAYPEYHEEGFNAMVERFAADPFYKLHLVAKEFVKSPYFKWEG